METASRVELLPIPKLDKATFGTKINNLNIPYTITSPGYYVVTENLIGTGDIITISDNTANAIVLDLGGQQISGGRIVVDTNSSSPFRSNIIIKNGTISGYASGPGITVDNITVGTNTVQNMLIQNVTVTDCQSGVYINGTTIQGLILDHVKVSRFTTYGIYVANATSCLLEKCDVSYTTSLTAVCYYFTACSIATLRYCCAEYAEFGFGFNLCDDFILRELRAGECDDTSFAFDNSARFMIYKCVSNASWSSGALTGSGFDIGEAVACDGVYLYACSVDQFASNRSAFEVSNASDTNVAFVNCTNTKNEGSYGVVCNASSTRGLILDCNVSGTTSGIDCNAGTNWVCFGNYANSVSGSSVTDTITKAGILTTTGRWANVIN